MSRYPISDTNLGPYGKPLIPIEFKEQTPLTERGYQTVLESREAIRAILRGEDPRKLVIFGPCSVHREESFKEFVERVIPVAERYKDKLLTVVRGYMEKPRTRKAWRGFIVDPNLKGEINYHEGYRRARQLLVYSTDLGVPVATEFVDVKTPNIIDDGISWAAIGARTVEVNEHRGMASGISMPVGMKNNTSGNVMKAIDAIVTASEPDEFPALNPQGWTCPTPTNGNPYVHLVLRGGEQTGPNYDRGNVQLAQGMLVKEGLRPNVLVDCSHDNTRNHNGEKEYARQLLVGEDVSRQMVDGNRHLIGMMFEVHLNVGSLKLPKDLKSSDFDPQKLPHGVSVTDPCAPLEDMIHFLDNLYRSL